MILRKVKIGKTTVTLERDLIDGLFVVVKGRNVMWVADTEESAVQYFNQLTAA